MLTINLDGNRLGGTTSRNIGQVTYLNKPKILCHWHFPLHIIQILTKGFL